ncbi:MAG: ATP-binding protein [Thermoanaerobaculia bacterium]|nr:ATP-binding protein [Thermoanaerobaculia bacterium]
MPARPRPTKRRLRSTMESVLLHDMRNMGFRLGLVLENFEENFEDPDFKRSVVELLQGTREKLDTMVSRWTAHADSILIKVEVDVNDLVREVLRVARVRGAAGNRPPGVTTELAPLPRVWGDPHYLQDALLSIVQNALEAVAPAGGRVIVRSHEERRGRKHTVVVEIEDDGPGMSEEFVRNRLFRPFQTTKPEGVGLGLYTSSQILLFHRGDLVVKSRPGEGTLVRAILPVEAPS